MLFICRLTTWQSRRRTGTVSGSNSIRRASPSTIAVLPTPGSPMSITELARSRWQRISITCCISSVAAEERRDLVLPRELVQVGREVLQERRQLEPLPQALLALLEVAHPRRDARHEQLGLDAVPPDDRHGNALALLEDRREQVDRLDRLAARAARVVERQLEQQLGRRRHAQCRGPANAGTIRRCSSSACRISCGFSSRSRITCANMSHSTCANARKTCSLVSSECSRRRDSSTARSTTRWADSAILFCDNVEVFHALDRLRSRSCCPGKQQKTRQRRTRRIGQLTGARASDRKSRGEASGIDVGEASATCPARE